MGVLPQCGSLHVFVSDCQGRPTYNAVDNRLTSLTACSTSPYEDPFHYSL